MIKCSKQLKIQMEDILGDKKNFWILHKIQFQKKLKDCTDNIKNKCNQRLTIYKPNYRTKFKLLTSLRVKKMLGKNN
jgi:hypothetical protein